MAAIVASCQWLGGAFAGSDADPDSNNHHASEVQTIPGMPPVVDPENLYSEIARRQHEPGGRRTRSIASMCRTCVRRSVTVIDPETLKVVDTFKVGLNPQHVIPSLRPADALGGEQCREPHQRQRDADRPPAPASRARRSRSTTRTTCTSRPDGKSAIVVAEESQRLDFRDPHTMALQYSIDAPSCGGINHADFSIDGRYAIFTCEFDGSIAKIDLVEPQGAGLPRAADAGTR